MNHIHEDDIIIMEDVEELMIDSDTKLDTEAVYTLYFYVILVIARPRLHYKLHVYIK